MWAPTLEELDVFTEAPPEGATVSQGEGGRGWGAREDGQEGASLGDQRPSPRGPGRESREFVNMNEELPFCVH